MSQIKREQMDYRKEYFKKNPGLFGCVWFCSQCGRPLFGKDQVQVDHIVPLANVLGQNKTFNCVAICRKCNQKKRDKVGLYTVKGQIAKIFEVLLFTAKKIVFLGIKACLNLLALLGKAVINLISAPLRSGNIVVRLVAIVAYACAIFWLISRFM